MTAVELVIATALFLVGTRSLVRWMRTDFAPRSRGEHVVYALHLTGRVGMWFALGAFFVGSAVVDHPDRLAWYGLVIIALASVQLITGFVLSRAPSDGPADPQAGPRTDAD